MKKIVDKINQLSLLHVWLFLLLFFLPFQKPYKTWIKPLSQWAFKGEALSPFFYDRDLRYYLGDFLMLGVLVCAFFSFRSSLKTFVWEGSRKYLLLFLVFSLLSIIFSASNHVLWPYLRLFQFALPLLLCLILGQEQESARLLKIAFLILFAVSLCEALIAIWQYFSQHSIGLSGLGEKKLLLDEAPTFPMATKERWLLDRFFGTHAPSCLILRAHGTFKHPNVLGAFLGMSLFISSHLFLDTKRRWSKPLFACAIPFQLFALTLSFSRAAILGVVGGGALYLAFLFFQKQWRKRAFQLLCIFALAGGGTLALLHDQLLQRGGVINYNKWVKGASDAGRIAYFKVALKMAKQRPWVGHGFNQYENAVVPYLTGEENYHIQRVHNIFLLLLVDIGVLGLLAFLIFFLSMLIAAFKSGFDLSKATLALILLFFFWAGCVDHFIITCFQGRLMLFLMAGLFLMHEPKPLPKREIQSPSSLQGC